MVFNGFQPVVNSDWVGTMMAVFCTILLTIVGFYLVSNTIRREFVREWVTILATTPVSNLIYLLTNIRQQLPRSDRMHFYLDRDCRRMQLLSSYSGDFSLADLLMPFAVITLPCSHWSPVWQLYLNHPSGCAVLLGTFYYLLVIEFMIVGTLVADQPLLDLIGYHRFTAAWSRPYWRHTPARQSACKWDLSASSKT